MPKRITMYVSMGGGFFCQHAQGADQTDGEVTLCVTCEEMRKGGVPMVLNSGNFEVVLQPTDRPGHYAPALIANTGVTLARWSAVMDDDDVRSH